MTLRLLNSKIEELKEVTGNRDVMNGGVAGGVTAASAIAALQEASGKISRDSNLMAYDAFRRLTLMIIELVRQFYGLPRWFLIRGVGAEDFVQYDNSGLLARREDGGYRLPVFDVRVDPQKSTPYTKMAQNELALQLLNAGFFTPGNETAALACLNIMDFADKDRVAETVARGERLKAAAELGLRLAEKYEPALAAEIAHALETPRRSPTQVKRLPSVAGSSSEPKRMAAARDRARKTSQVR